MNRYLAALVFSALAVVILVAGCASAASAPVKAASPPTTAPAATKPALATAQPATSSATTAAWPEKGKTITIIVPFPAGGTTDLAARVLATYLQKDLGTPVQVVDKPGASSQVGLTELAQAKPDGYTMAYFILQNAIPIYLDPSRNAGFTRKSFVPIAMVGEDPKMVAVQASSPWKTMKDLVDAAKASPNTLTFGAGGVLSPEDIWGLQLQQAAGIKFSTVQFDGIAPTMAALLGGQVNFATGSMGALAGPMKDNKVRALAIAANRPSPLAPQVPTIDSQGYKEYCLLSKAIAVPAGTPQNVVDILSNAVQKTMADPTQKQKILAMDMDYQYTGPAETTAYWDQLEKQIAPLISLAKK